MFKRAEKRELSENAWDSREMREIWQVWSNNNMTAVV